MRTELNLARRIYVLAVALVSLALGSASFDVVAVAVVDRLIGIDAEVPLLGVAGIIVQMPIWAIHWTLAQRDANRSLAERGSLLRRAYLYGVMTAGLAVSARWISFWNHALGRVRDTGRNRRKCYRRHDRTGPVGLPPTRHRV